jgi:hypothetical protein
MRRHVILLLLLLLSLPLSAQDEASTDSTTAGGKHLLFQLTDGIVTTVRHTGRRIRKAGREFNAIDTAFISPNLYNLAFMLETSTWHEQYRLGTTGSATPRQSINLSPDASFKLGVYFGWRWIFLGYTFDVQDLFGGHKDRAKKKEWALNIYSSKFGVDLYYRKTGSDFKIRSVSGFELDQSLRNEPFNGLESRIKGLNAYWIFNYKRFSYPAAYSQSTNQRRSTGSMMAGFSYSQHTILFDPDRLPVALGDQLGPSLRFSKVRYSDYGLTVGYGYNWVFAHNWLANLSLLPTLAYKKSRIDDVSYADHWTRDLNVDFISRLGVVYNNAKYFAGASLLTHTYDYRKQNFALTNSFSTLRVYAGFNFWRKKAKEKKKKEKL